MKASPRQTGQKTRRTKTPSTQAGRRQIPTLDISLQGEARLADYVTAIAWSPDGQWLSAASAAGDIVLYATAEPVQGLDTQRTSVPKTILQKTENLPGTASRLLRTANGEAVSSLRFSADSRFLAAAGQAGTVWVWPIEPSMETLPPVLIEKHHPGAWIDSLAWHPQQHQLAYGVGSQAIVWDVVDQTQIELAFQASSVLHAAWHPQGQFLAVSGHGGMKVWNQEDWTLPPQSVAVPGASLEGAWSPEGRYLASGNLDRTLTVMEWDSPPPWLMQGFPGKVRRLAWSLSADPSPPQLAAACMEGITVWERQGDQGWKSRVLKHHEGTVEAIAFQPHGQVLASASQEGRIALWQQKNQPAHTLKGFRQGASCLSWRPCGTQLAAGGSAGELFLWKVVARQKKGFG